VPDEEWGQTDRCGHRAGAGESIDSDELRAFVRKQLRTSKTPDQIVVWKSSRTRTPASLSPEGCRRLDGGED